MASAIASTHPRRSSTTMTTLTMAAKGTPPKPPIPARRVIMDINFKISRKNYVQAILYLPFPHFNFNLVLSLLHMQPSVTAQFLIFRHGLLQLTIYMHRESCNDTWH